MRIADVLRGKGNGVVTVSRDCPVTALLATMAEHNIGAAVVTDGEALVGIVSERDVVRWLDRRGAEVLAAPVAQIMTSPVATCTPDDSVHSLAVTMTQRRIRHLPVLVDGRLVGVVSIGDVVKSRIAQLETDREQLEAYIYQQ